MESNPHSAFLVSVVSHFVILLLFIVSIEFSSVMPVLVNTAEDMKVINATVVNAPPLPSLPEPAPMPADPLPPVVPKVAPQPEPPKPVVSQPVPKPIVDIQKQQAIALKVQRKKQLIKQKADIAKQLLEDVKKQTAVEKIKKQKVLQKSLESELKAEAAKTLEKQMLSEERRAGSAKSRGVVNKYKALILQAISRKWLVPSGVNRNLSSELLIRLAPGGAVLDVRVTRSSGDVALDRSARDAVFKASPLPVPEDKDDFESFRQFALKVKPTDLIDAGY